MSYFSSKIATFCQFVGEFEAREG